MSDENVVIQTLKDVKILDDNNQFTELGIRLLIILGLNIATDIFKIIYEKMENNNNE